MSLYAVGHCLVFYTDSKWHILDQRLHPKSLLQLNYILLKCLIHILQTRRPVVYIDR